MKNWTAITAFLLNEGETPSFDKTVIIITEANKKIITNSEKKKRKKKRIWVGWEKRGRKGNKVFMFLFFKTPLFL